MGKWSKASLSVGLGALAGGLIVFGCAVRGIGATLFTFNFLVYAALVGGAVGFLGAAFAVLALLKRERHVVVVLAALALNLGLAAVGATFLILLPT